MHNLNPFDETKVEQTRPEIRRDNDNEHQRKDNNPFIGEGENHSNQGINPYTTTKLGRARSQSESVVTHANKLANRQKYSNQIRQQHSKVDEIDLLDSTSNLYGVGAFHHESPYDCVLPHRNVNETVAPVHAFSQDEELNQPSTSLSYDDFNKRNHRYTTYDIHLTSRDSFLEGSTAYVPPSSQQDDDKQEKRQSIFRRIIGTRRKNDLNDFEIINEIIPEQQQQQGISSKPPRKATRVEILKKLG